MVRRRAAEGLSLSLLDLLCCAFGGVIVLAIVFSALIRRAAAPPISSHVVLHLEARPPTVGEDATRCGAIIGVRIDGPSGSVVELHPYAGVGSEQRRLSNKATVRYAYRCRHLVLVIDGLEPGAYRVHPWLDDYPFERGARPAPSDELQLSLWGGTGPPQRHLLAWTAIAEEERSFSKAGIELQVTADAAR